MNSNNKLLLVILVSTLFLASAIIINTFDDRQLVKRIGCLEAGTVYVRYDGDYGFCNNIISKTSPLQHIYETKTLREIFFGF
jgi:cell division protein FtsL